MNRDLTVGKPASVLWRFCLPLFGSVIFQQLYNIADSLVAGKFIGENALAAVGNSYEVTLIFIAFAFGCNMGCSVVVSRLFGAKDYCQVKTAVSTALLMTGGVCLALMAFGLLMGGSLLGMLRTPPELMADSALYLNIYVLGLPFLFFYNVATGIFSALGDSRTPFLFLALSSLSNILIDILFVRFFSMGVAGVAWATFLCQGVSCVLAVITVFRRMRSLPANGKKAPLFSGPLLRQIVVIAVPSTLQQSFVSVGNLIIQGVINSFGSGVMAGYSAAVKMNNLVITSFTTLANGISNYTAQNIGAGRQERVREGLKAGLKMVWMLCVPFFALYFFMGETFIRFFMDDPTDMALNAGVVFLRILSPFYFVVAAKLAADGVLRGAGLMRPFMIATFTDLILRVSLAALLAGTALGSTGIWCAWPIGWTVATGLSLLFYRKAFPSTNQGADV
ncbi:MAG: MATE family efflux transporter [Clostridia bacterium]|nr:MATE family efflux transporter [Clostridia bacterium]